MAEISGGLIMVLTRRWPQRFQDYLLALGSGFILALVLTRLIPESINAVGEAGALMLMIGYAVLHLFEHTLVPHLHFGEEVHTERMISKTASLSALSGLFIHALFDGISISIALKFNYLLGILVFVAIFLHKFPEGLTIASIMFAAEKKAKTAFLSSTLLGVATFAGILLGFLISGISDKVLGYSFAFIAGVALYVGATDLIPEINNSKHRETPVVVFIGMLMFYIAADLLHKVIK
jgi:zinc transporter ZupT